MKRIDNKVISIVFLIVIVAVLSWSNFKYYSIANGLNNGTEQVKDSSKEALIAEIKDLRSQLQAKQENNESKVTNDISIFVAAYYDNDDSKITAKDRINNLKPLMTENGFSQINLYSDGDTDGASEDYIPQYKYSAKTDIKEIYHKKTGDNRAKALAVCDLTVTTVSGTNHSMILLEVECTYGTTANRWLVDEINYNNILNASANDF